MDLRRSPACKHGLRVLRSGQNNCGQDWAGWMCPLRECDPIWISTGKVAHFQAHAVFRQYPLIVHALNAIASISQVVIGLCGVSSAMAFVATGRIGAAALFLFSALCILMIQREQLRFNRKRWAFELRVFLSACDAIVRELESRESGDMTVGEATNVYEPGKWMVK